MSALEIINNRNIENVLRLLVESKENNKIDILTKNNK